ncbi:MAG: ABC transporter substrate-binding protein, partial [Halomonas venusta]|nr:ABC transporter substrate-binding protein [Halomonas venusta]
MLPSPLRLSLPIALVAPLLLAGCFDEQRDTTSAEVGERIRLAMLQPPRSGLTPLSDDAFKLS